MIPIIIDIEASGFGANSYPIEIGIATETGTSHCYLIKPEPHWQHWDSEAEKIHQISRDTLLTYGLPALEVAQSLNLLLRGKTLYSDAWGHDLSWLGKLFDVCDQPQLFRLDSIRSLIKESDVAYWHTTKEQIIARHRLDRHRASEDAKILQKTYLSITADSY